MAMYKHKRYIKQDEFNNLLKKGGLAIFADQEGRWTITDGVKYILDESKAHETVKI